MSNRLTKAQRAEVFTACEGKCYVCGSRVDPLGSWHVAEQDHVTDGVLVLLDTPCNEMLRGRSFAELRFVLSQKVMAARETEARWGGLAPSGAAVRLTASARRRHGAVRGGRR